MSLPIGIAPPHPPTVTDIIVFLLLGIVAIMLFEYAVYTEARKRGSKITHREALKQAMIFIKQTIIIVSRFVLLWLITLLPLVVLVNTTTLSIVLVIYSLLGEIRSPLPMGLVIAISIIFLLANITIMHYFFSKYGSIYKLPVAYCVRTDIKQFLEKRPEIFLGVVPGSIMYVMTFFALMEAFLYSNSIVLNISILIVFVLLYVYVVFNKKYKEAINLIEKILGKDKIF